MDTKEADLSNLENAKTERIQTILCDVWVIPTHKKLFLYSYYYYSITLVSKEPCQYFEKNINAKIHVNSEHEK